MYNKGFNLGLICLLAVIQATAQINYVSNDNQTGDWLDDNSWIDVAAWANQNPSQPTNSTASSIDVYGYITRQGDLNVTNANPVITVRDTLVVTGNTLLGSGASLNVPAGGLLIVTGNLTTQGAFTLGNAGRVVVGGDVSVTNGSITNNQDFYILGSTSVSGGGGVLGCASPPCDPATLFGDESDLRNNDPSLEIFLQTLSVLPVEYVSFTAYGEQQGITLSWATASELNNDYFEIQRSVNGTDFQTIGRVDGHGTSYHTIQYSFTDTSPKDGVNYYRLKQYDFDGAFEYSQLVREFFNLKPVVDLKFFPNPASEKLNIIFDQRFLNTNVQVKLYDSKGIVAVEQEIIPTSLASVIELDRLEDPGIYMLHVSNHAFEEFNPILVTR